MDISTTPCETMSVTHVPCAFCDGHSLQALAISLFLSLHPRKMTNNYPILSAYCYLSVTSHHYERSSKFIRFPWFWSSCTSAGSRFLPMEVACKPTNIPALSWKSPLCWWVAHVSLPNLWGQALTPEHPHCAHSQLHQGTAAGAKEGETEECPAP